MEVSFCLVNSHRCFSGEFLVANGAGVLLLNCLKGELQVDFSKGTLEDDRLLWRFWKGLLKVHLGELLVETSSLEIFAWSREHFLSG